MASPAVLSPLSPSFPVPSTVVSTFQDEEEAPFAHELPHVEAYEDHRVQKDLPHNHKTDHLDHPVKHPHHKPAATSVKGPQSALGRTATFALELPHVEAYEDHRVQKDLPHNHKTDHLDHPVKHPHPHPKSAAAAQPAPTSDSATVEDLTSSFQRTATFALELPHVEAYEDHRVQKDLPHNHKTDMFVHPPKHSHVKSDQSIHPPMVLTPEQK